MCIPKNHPIDSNLYCHKSRKLYVPAHVDDLLVAGADDVRKPFMSDVGRVALRRQPNWCQGLSAQSLVHGRRLRRSGDSIQCVHDSMAQI